MWVHNTIRINTSTTGFNIGCIDEFNQFDLNNINIAVSENHLR